MTPDAILQRMEEGDQGTFGRFVAQSLNLYSGELPDRENRPQVSRIIPGTYQAISTYSPKFGRHLYLIGPVTGRLGIRVHSANLMGDIEKGYRSQLNGCISFGERLGWIEGQKALLLSAPAVRRFESFFAHKPFTLEIRDIGG